MNPVIRRLSVVRRYGANIPGYLDDVLARAAMVDEAGDRVAWAPAVWAALREKYSAERDRRFGTVQQPVAVQPCGSCGKGAGPGSKPAEIEAMLRGD